MADEKLFFYRGFPLIRSGNIIFYGSGGDEFAARLQIKDTNKINDEDIPNKILVQLVPRDMSDIAKARKGEYTGLYEALDVAHTWLNDALFG